MISEGLNLVLLAGCLLYFFFAVCLAVTDIRTGLLPDSITLSLLWLGLIFHTLIAPDKLAVAIYGAVGGYLSLWLLYWCFFFITQREGLGYGDLKLLAAIGAWNGWQSLPIVLVIASGSGMVLFAVSRFIQRKSVGQLPFGPSLVFAGWGVFIWSL